jgi:K+-sensing histidine kinase KdpD
MLNLIENVVQHTTSERIQISAEYDQSKQLLKINVINTTRNLPSIERGQLFSKFCSLPCSGLIHPHGLGMGLYHSRQICESHHKGKLTFEYCDIYQGYSEFGEIIFCLQVPTHSKPTIFDPEDPPRLTQVRRSSANFAELDPD